MIVYYINNLCGYYTIIILCEEGKEICIHNTTCWLLDSIRYSNYVDNLLYFTRIIFSHFTFIQYDSSY